MTVLIKKLFARFIALIPSWIKKPVRLLRDWIFDLRTREIVDAQKQALQELLRAKPSKQPVIIFAPSLTWDTQLFQRPQQLAIALANQGTMVIYMMMKPDLNKAPLEQISPNLYLANILMKSVADLPSPFVYILTWNTGYLKSFHSPRVIYDFVDDINVFYGNKKDFIQAHQTLLKEASIVLVTAQKLYQEVIRFRADAILSSNAVDYAHFAIPTGSNNEIPKDLANILSLGQPIIGYYGALARWFDYNLLHCLAELRPGYSFVLIGPDYDGTIRDKILFDLPNIHWLGVKPYSQLPVYLQHFNVATIPFIVNEITHSTSPLKLFEYMAGGKPVVVTPMQESMHYPGVLVGATAEEFAFRIDEAILLERNSDYHQTIDQIARQNTWDERARSLLSALQKVS
jgi:glycosyltransferase involved in cell wall biosynthesis